MKRITMSVQEMAHEMGISRPKAYELTDRADFPCVRVGKRKIIPVDAFREWLEKQLKNECV